MLDRRVGCLEDRRAAARELASVFAEADRRVVENSAAAVARLPELARCSQPSVLLASVEPPPAAIASAVDRARAALGAAVARFHAGQYDAAEARLLPLVAEAARLAYDPLAAEILYALGSLHNAYDKADSVDHLERAYFAARGSGHDEVAVLAAIELVDVLGWSLLRFTEAENWAEHARAELKLHPNSRAEASLMTNLGLLAERRGRYAQGLTHYRRGLELLTRRGEAHGYLAARLHTHIGAVLESQARFHEALREYRASLRARAGVLAASHPDNANTLALLALASVEVGQAGAAVSYGLAGVAVAEVTLGASHGKTAFAHTALGSAYLAAGAIPAAIDEYQAARASYASAVPAPHPAGPGQIATRLSLAYARAGDRDRALSEAQLGYDLKVRALGDSHPFTMSSLTALGVALLDHGRAKEAAPLLARAVATLDRLNRDGQGTVPALIALGRCLVALNRPREAVAPLVRAVFLAEAQALAPAVRGDARALLARAVGR
jgi:tetratricopeptide (TPR) repeat protein